MMTLLHPGTNAGTSARREVRGLVGSQRINPRPISNDCSLSGYVQPQGGFTPQICKGDYDVVW
jgi:hypothetical protein